VITRAPAKLNLCLFLGPLRDDGRHEICSLFQPLTLSDEIAVTPAERDEVVCPSVEGPNLAGAALEALRSRGWKHEPVRIEIDKRIPVAGGLGGGSADAAAVLRLARDEVDDLSEIATSLGADVPSQLDPSPCLVRGGGEIVEPLPLPSEYAVVLVPDRAGLGTAEVYAEADRLGLGRSSAELEEMARRIRAAASAGASPLGFTELLTNDLEPAALSLRPSLDEALAGLRDAGAIVALLTGSGPTAFGLFENIAEADRAAARLPVRHASAMVASPDRFK
jgi:4-diphosphocytidyl-2-C-methyl-D-erythritol kinase